MGVVIIKFALFYDFEGLGQEIEQVNKSILLPFAEIGIVTSKKQEFFKN